MPRLIRCLAVSLTLLAVPVLAQSSKDEKKDAKKPGKSPAPTKKYEVVNTLSVILGGVTTEDQTLSFVVPGQYGHEPQTVSLAEGIKVRTRDLPERTDEKGKPKKYTPQEIKALRGDDPKLPGYAADLDKLTGGESAQITLGREKFTSKTKPKDARSADKLYVTMILVLSDNKPANKPVGKKK